MNVITEPLPQLCKYDRILAGLLSDILSIRDGCRRQLALQGSLGRIYDKVGRGERISSGYISLGSPPSKASKEHSNTLSRYIVALVKESFTPAVCPPNHIVISLLTSFSGSCSTR